MWFADWLASPIQSNKIYTVPILILSTFRAPFLNCKIYFAFGAVLCDIACLSHIMEGKK